jgi:hypothetical protein
MREILRRRSVNRGSAFWRAIIRALMSRSLSPSYPKAEHESPGWQAAMEALILVAETDGRCSPGSAFMRVLNRSWSDDRRSIAVILLAQPHSRPSVTSETCAADRRKIASLANFVGAIIDQCRADGRCPMSGKSRYGSSFGSSNRHHAAEETRSTAAATVATDAAVQASWAQYVQNLVSEQIAALHDGVIEGLGEAINERLDRLFDKAKKHLRRELDGNSVKLEKALAGIRAARAEMREEIHTKLRAQMRVEIADRTALIKQPADGVPGPRGEKGEPGSLPMVEPYTAGRIYYRANVVADQTGSYQAKHDTAKAPCPESEDWTCIARSGADGKDGRTFRPRGTCDPAKDYRRLDIAMLNASSFVALRDDPGPCPGENWQLFASVGKRGQKGLKRERGERGPQVGWRLRRGSLVLKSTPRTISICSTATALVTSFRFARRSSGSLRRHAREGRNLPRSP